MRETTKKLFAILNDNRQTGIGLSPQRSQENRNMYAVKNKQTQKQGKQCAR